MEEWIWSKYILSIETPKTENVKVEERAGQDGWWGCVKLNVSYMSKTAKMKPINIYTQYALKNGWGQKLSNLSTVMQLVKHGCEPRLSGPTGQSGR